MDNWWKNRPRGRYHTASTNEAVPQIVNLPKITGLIDLVPSEFRLSQNYPNPFSEKTTIKLCVAYKTRVKLEVFDPEGAKVKTLLGEEKEAGTYKIELDASSLPGSGLGPPEASFVYRLQAGDPPRGPSSNLGTVSSEHAEGSNGSGQVFVAAKKMVVQKNGPM